MESRFKFMTFGFKTMSNHYMSLKLKLIGKCKFNQLISILIGQRLGLQFH
jgi:hypothetical protein